MSHLINKYDKKIHVIWAVIVLLLGVGAVFWQPTLLKDAPTALGTIGTFATAYGVLFAIIELRRSYAASQLATAAAEKAFQAVTSLVTAREIIECQSAIIMAVCTLDEHKTIASHVLCQIVKLYSQIFHAELKDPLSLHRRNQAIIESYNFNPNIEKSKSAKSKTKNALLSITSQLAQLQGATKNFTEYKNDSSSPS